MSDGLPSVCVIIAAKNADSTVGRAVRSALGEAGVREVVVVDDASEDATVAVAHCADDGSGRLKIVRLGQNQGPAAARNLALSLATSECVCILDADDYFLPGRIAKLFGSFGCEWEMLADNIIIIPQQLDSGEILLPQNEDVGQSFDIDLERFVLGNISRSGRPRSELGFLKPIIKRAFLDEHGLRYDERLRLGEDYALYVRALIAGARFRVINALGYVAIEREQSISSCHSRADLEALVEFDTSCLSNTPTLSASERRALKAHLVATIKKSVYRKTLDTKRERGVISALGIMARRPACITYIGAETLRAKATLLDRYRRGSWPSVLCRHSSGRYSNPKALTLFSRVRMITGQLVS